MATIGNLGKKIVFSTSDKKILNFSDFKQKVSGRWANHERILKKPQSEFLGPDLREVSFTITLNALQGVRPRKVMESMEKMVEKGTVEKLVIGGKKVGSNKWKMTQMSESWDVVLNKGELMKATLNITLEEYI